MIAGHFGLAALVKSHERSTPLWALMLATQWLDVVFVPLMVAKVETIVPAPGTQGGHGDSIIYADYTHSLIGALALAALFGVAAAWSWTRRTGVVLGAVVFSHWILDALVHRADLPILPANAGGLPRIGFGLWRMPAVAVGIELALLAAGALLYWRAAGRLPQARGSLVGLLTLAAGLATLGLDVLGD